MKILFLIVCLFSYVFSSNLDLKLSQSEAKYLTTLDMIKVCVKSNYAPVEWIENHKVKGITADYLDLISEKINLPFGVVETNTHAELYNNIKNNRCDIVTSIPSNIQSRDLLKYTSSYLSEPLVILRKAINHEDSLNIFSFYNPIASIKNHFAVDVLEKNSKNLKLLQLNSISEALDRIRKNEIFGLIDAQSIVLNNVKKRNFHNIGTINKIPFMVHYSIGVHQKDTILHSILQKAVVSIEPTQVEKIYYKYTAKTDQKSERYKFVVQVFFFAISLVLILIYFGLYFKEENKKKLQKEVLIIRQNRFAQMGEMTDILAHQWRQPLSAISSTANNLIFKLLTNQEIEKTLFLSEIELIESYSQHLSKTINDFRSFLHTNKELKIVDINHLLKMTVKIIEPTLKSANIALDLKDTPEIMVKAYSSELKQVFLSILQNAYETIKEKNTKNGYIKIETYREEKNCVVKISDNGGGIPENIIDQIFEPHFTTKNQKGGTGIGLYISKAIIESHLGARIFAKNEKEGVSFYIIFSVIS